MVTSIRLQNFRSYSDSVFEFEPGVNIVVGPNASGKTNLLEAVLVLAVGSSYKAKDSELIKNKKPWSRVDANLDGRSRTLKIERTGEATNKTFLIDDKPFKRLNLERTLPIVIFEPNHLQIFIRGPKARRDWLDDLVARTKPGFRQTLNRYNRTLAQRNALLKKGARSGDQQLFVWNVRLSELGSQIAAGRQALINQLNKKLSSTYSQIAGSRFRINAEYASHFPVDQYASRMLSSLEKSEQLDLARGFTGSGPHREDIVFYMGKHPVNQIASRGEARSLLLALKILELDLVEAARGLKPLLLLDDVFSELDGARRHALVDKLSGHQSIITTTDADAVIKYFGKKQKLIALGRQA